MKRRITWKAYHKWVGLCFTFFILMFCFSGIVLNHRSLFSACEVSRWWLPKSYHYQHWNNGFVKGTLALGNDEWLLYGNAGVWKTDKTWRNVEPMNQGFAAGVDNVKINNLIKLGDGSLWCAALYDIYRYDGSSWQVVKLPHNTERMADITQKGDTLVVLTRSYLYTSLAPYTQFTQYELATPANYSPKVSLFRTIWLLHSGELFGTVGKIVVDILGIVIVFLCLTGIVYFFFPAWIKRCNKRRKPIKPYAKTMNISAKWHKRLGAWLIVLTLLLAVTGTCLRPPLMIPFVLTNTAPIPGTTLAADNAWHDKLRAIRWDEQQGVWYLSTSMGFYSLSHFNSTPQALIGAPYISPMGINVFEKQTDGSWLIGSFSGMFRWYPQQARVLDYFTGNEATVGGRPVGSVAVSGYSADIAEKPIIFTYSEGVGAENSALPPMPKIAQVQPMSLWNFCLELHVGRTYTPFLGVVSELFIFISGTLLTLILLSGYIVHKRRR